MPIEKPRTVSGVVKRFSYDGGYGFVSTHLGDVYLSASVARACGYFDLDRGDEVSVDFIEENRGLTAVGLFVRFTTNPEVHREGYISLPVQ